MKLQDFIQAKNSSYHFQMIGENVIRIRQDGYKLTDFTLDTLSDELDRDNSAERYVVLSKAWDLLYKWVSRP
jgi:hypothetical protein